MVDYGTSDGLSEMRRHSVADERCYFLLRTHQSDAGAIGLSEEKVVRERLEASTFTKR